MSRNRWAHVWSKNLGYKTLGVDNFTSLEETYALDDLSKYATQVKNAALYEHSFENVTIRLVMSAMLCVASVLRANITPVWRSWMLVSHIAISVSA